MLPKENITDVPAPSFDIDDVDSPSASKQSPFHVLLQKYTQLEKENEDLKNQNTKSMNEIEALREKIKHLQEGAGIADNKCLEARVKSFF